jgi:hypothetical protein
MSSIKRPLPLVLPRRAPRSVCPVCGEVSYSRAGVHPQCEQARADRARMRRLAPPAPRRGRAANPLALKPWHKRCPRCQVQLHIRSAACRCGHEFAGTADRK